MLCKQPPMEMAGPVPACAAAPSFIPKVFTIGCVPVVAGLLILWQAPDLPEAKTAANRAVRRGFEHG